MARQEYYRLVADYGYGDKTWVERFMPAEEAIAAFNQQAHCDYTTIDECLDADHLIYSVQVDHDGDVEDWDWMDS